MRRRQELLLAQDHARWERNQGQALSKLDADLIYPDTDAQYRAVPQAGGAVVAGAAPMGEPESQPAPVLEGIAGYGSDGDDT
jgi:hypothetical protein